ncbi:glycosyltransferase family 39 protein [Actinocorallia sp. API 0066]|uniref:glycosyltransferase family 39 protein n=1 Tax=Actinocorallia sp. API 0066 TaxID=2896846 RepID=UPI001E319A90|nr:glycosyltransferase family 39 protein [Actinocorallia sp. API 0066]MCD0453527.1 glycosyltransferase family 39 protein [Actinocorallia sp. API 0066]
MKTRLPLSAAALPLLTGLAAFAAVCWRLGTPSLWRDEAVTAELAGRSLPQLARVLGEIDAVHAAYYVLMQGWTAVAGDSVIALRLPSALAAAVAAGLTAALGRELASPRAGVIAGLLVAASPFVARHAQEARQYALVMALAVLATWLLLRVGSRIGWAWYAVAVVLLGAAHLFSLLLLPAHLITVLLTRRADWRSWVVATGAALVPLAGLAYVAAGQRYQVGWITEPTWKNVSNLLEGLGWGPYFMAPALLLAVYAVARRSPVAAVAVPWLVLPPVLLLGVSLASPLYVQRYLLFCLPAAALLVAAGLDLLPWRPLAYAGLAAAVLAAGPANLDVRRQQARVDDLRTLADVVTEHRQKGDGLVFTDVRFRPLLATYPTAWEGLPDVLLRRSPVRTGDLKGAEIAKAAYPDALAPYARVWLVDNRVAFLPGSKAAAPAKRAALDEAGLTLVREWKYKGGKVGLYERTGPPAELPELHERTAVPPAADQ